MQKHDINSYHIYGMGAALADIEIEVDDAFLAKNGVEKGVMTLIDLERHNQLIDALKGYDIHTAACGGSGANTILAAHRFGSCVYYSCRIANDKYGQLYHRSMTEARIAINEQPYQADDVTGKCLVMITPDADRTMNTFLGVNERLNSADLDPEAIKASEYLYIEGYLLSCETRHKVVMEAKRIAESHGVKTCLSLSDPTIVEIYRERMTTVIGRGIDLLFCNADEAKAWTGKTELNDIFTELKKITKTFAVTCGADGAVVFDGENIISIPSCKVEAIDTNGAGDMFAGAFLHGIIAGYSFQWAGKLACAAAAEVVSGYGPQLTLEKHQEILRSVLGVAQEEGSRQVCLAG